jgi:g-D-glutamyl-meso-diaminopimelate peptidase
VIYWQFRDIFVPGAKELGERLAQVSGYTLEDTPYESAFAGYKDWFIQNFRKPGYTIEAGSGENPLPLCQFDEIYRENLGILVTAALEILPKS